MKRWILVLGLMLRPWEVSAVDVTQLLPMSIEQILDASTLDEKIVREKMMTHPDFPGEQVKRLTVRYFSHEWKDGPWYGAVNIYVPENIPEANPHGCGSMTHVNTFRMWIDHCFFDRPLSQVTEVETEWTDLGLKVDVEIQGKPEVRKVAVYYHQTSDASFFDIGRANEFPNTDHFTKASFEALVMNVDGDGYSAVIPYDEQGGEYVALFVHVEDFAGKTTGYVSSMMRWVQKLK